MNKSCELCKKKAEIYCDSDKAFLCCGCDAVVHSANFLVARHSRSLLCHVCQSLTEWTATGRKLTPAASTCRSCVVEEEDLSCTDENYDYDDDEGGGVEEENQVVPPGSTTNKLEAEESSTSEESTNGQRLNSSKRMRDSDDEVINTSQIIRTSSTTKCRRIEMGGGGDQKAEEIESMIDNHEICDREPRAVDSESGESS